MPELTLASVAARCCITLAMRHCWRRLGMISSIGQSVTYLLACRAPPILTSRLLGFTGFERPSAYSSTSCYLCGEAVRYLLKCAELQTFPLVVVLNLLPATRSPFARRGFMLLQAIAHFQLPLLNYGTNFPAITLLPRH
jgi:hypothetical protein